MRNREISEQEGTKHVLLNIEVNESSRTYRKTCRMAHSMLVLPWFMKVNSASLLSENINDLPEMQSVRQYWVLQFDFDRY